MKRYRQLNESETIQPGDEVCVDDQWHLTKCEGQKVPNPKLISHRLYRREIVTVYLLKRDDSAEVIIHDSADSCAESVKALMDEGATCTINIEVKDMDRAEFDSLPEFQGW